MERTSCRRKRRRTRLLAQVVALLTVGGTAVRAEVQQLDVERSRLILRNVEREIEKHYYDPTFRGIDLHARFEQAEAALTQATSLGQLFGFIALAVLDFHDSHTWFLPPPRTVRVEYGWRVQAFGDSCLVTAVKPGSDAEAKGLRPGDRLLAVDGYALTRENLQLFLYRYHLLQPQETLRLLVQGPDGERREVAVAGALETQKRLVDLTDPEGVDFWKLVRAAQDASDEHRSWTLGPREGGKRIRLWRMPAFGGGERAIRKMLGSAGGHDSLILDLRGNGGGSLDMLLDLVGRLFDHDVQVARVKGRDSQEALVAKRERTAAFDGEVVVLVDSLSASASEILARLVQLEGRGKVLGDRSAGAVMTSRVYPQKLGWNTQVQYAIQISEGDVLMPDGGRLEGVGVIPDELILPTADDLASGRDPVLAHAARLLGVQLDPAKAGEFTRFQWD